VRPKVPTGDRRTSPGTPSPSRSTVLPTTRTGASGRVGTAAAPVTPPSRHRRLPDLPVSASQGLRARDAGQLPPPLPRRSRCRARRGRGAPPVRTGLDRRQRGPSLVSARVPGPAGEGASRDAAHRDHAPVCLRRLPDARSRRRC
jgi:hypothetical protein